MGKKKHDLFEIMGAQRRGRGARTQSTSGSTGILERVQSALAPSPAKGKSSGGRARGSKHAEPPRRDGLILAGVGFAALVVGFTLGRVTDAGTGPDLNVSRPGVIEDGAPGSSADPASFGVRPGRFGEDVASLSDEELSERLSNFGYLLLAYPAPETRDEDRAAFRRAKRLALWARDQGFEKVRVHKLPSSSSSFWAVVSHVDSLDDTADYARLAALEAPDFAPRLSTMIAKQTRPIQLPR